MDRSWMPTAAGVLNLLSGVISLLGALALVFTGTVTTVIPRMTADPQDDLPLGLVSGLFWSLALLALVVALVAVYGGVVALRRGGFGWPLAGAIAAFIAALPLGVIALIFVVGAERELRGEPPAPPPAG